ncbi:MAG: hypothetical protein DRJ50_12165, partial [Actinobacteria bacterium]
MQPVPFPYEGDKITPRALGDDLPFVNDADPVAETLGFLHVVRRVEDGHTFGTEAFHVLEDGVAALRIDPDRRFIEDQQVRFVEQS